MKNKTKRKNAKQRSGLIPVLDFLILLSLLFVVLSNILVLKKYQDSITKTLSMQILASNKPEFHILLARIFWQNQKYDQSRREITLAAGPGSEINKTGINMPSVLGTTSYPDYFSSWQNENNDLTEKFRFWENMTKKFPDYIDGYLFLAYYAHRLSREEIFNSTKTKLESMNIPAEKMKYIIGLSR